MKIIILCFWVIITRIGYYFLIQGSHNGLYYIQMSNLKDICQYLAVAGFLLICYKRQLARKIRHVIIFALVYCLSFAVIMLYPFLGGDISSGSESTLFVFNSFWAYASAALLLYLVFSSDDFSTKQA
ncbi:hypothetical protein GWR56_08910 [Mucilaginibacter sp. 14171R-50]|uniref:hypothetical protein n=1 Tax=Mucilaginibacter sp. 14171R-50 TaxID=2703789 RepID=UPI00138C5800|nr:hypothetical protein [Mucilaginibacter sp. 14171R-50]QHS55652.1 hypothetical protein GWR56_08910 [Mucilaginibacter sp. 14171R-50]